MRSFLSFDRFLITVMMLLIIGSCSDDVQTPILRLAEQSRSSQHGWYWSNPKPQGNHLFDVSLYDQNVGFAVGLQGAIARSTDGGQTWALQASGTTEPLSGVSATGPMTAVAVGANGTILRTVNRGVTWKRVQTGVIAHLDDVDFADAFHGIAVAHDVTLRTSDGGVTWKSLSRGFEDVDMVDGSTAFAVRQANIYRTTDGGATWDSLASAPDFRRLHGVSFSDGTTGTVVGELGTILRTADGGVSWSVQSSETTADLEAVQFADASHGIAVASQADFRQPILLRTSDGGDHWLHDDQWLVVEGAFPPYQAVAMLNSSTGVVVGALGNILRTTDGGASWVNKTHVAAGHVFSVSFANSDDGIAVGLPHILRTTDGGASWERQTMGDYKNLYDAAYCGPSIVVAAGDDREPGFQGGVILRSTDGGATWTTTHPQTPPLAGVDFGDACVGVAVGGDGTIVRTTDGGATWAVQAEQTVESLSDVSMLDANIGVAVGRHDTILRTIDGGVIWKYIPHTLILEDLNAVDFGNSDVGITVSRHRILRTVDGGVSWFEQPSGVDAEFVDVACKDRDTAAVLASIRFRGQVVMVTTDGGAHWAIHDVIATEHLFAITINDKKTVTAVGRFGTIIQAQDLLRPNV